MKKYIIVLVMVMCVSMLHSEDIKFRGLSYFVTREEVIEYFGEPDDVHSNFEGSEDLYYNDIEVAGYKSVMELYMRKDIFYSACYNIQQPSEVRYSYSNIEEGPYPQPYEIIRIYRDIYRKLAHLYGRATILNVPDEVDKDASLEEIIVFLDGELVDTRWELKDIYIWLNYYYGEKLEVNIYYLPKDEANNAGL